MFLKSYFAILFFELLSLVFWLCSGVVWQDDDVLLYGYELLQCLFGTELRSDLIHAYFNVLSNKENNYGHEIYCMSPNVPVHTLNSI